jgi:hypothetical protein
MRGKDVAVLDLARLFRGRQHDENYQGIAW